MSKTSMHCVCSATSSLRRATATSSGTEPVVHSRRSAELLKLLRKSLTPVIQHGEKSRTLYRNPLQHLPQGQVLDLIKYTRDTQFSSTGYGNCCGGCGQKASFHHHGEDQRGVLYPSKWTPLTSASFSLKCKIFFSVLAKRMTTHMVENKYIDTSVKKGGIPGFSGCLEHTGVLNQLIQEARQSVVWLDLANA